MNIKEYLKSRVNAIKSRYSYSGVLDSIYLSLVSETLSFKNTMHRLHQEFINQFNDSSYYLYLDDVLYDLIRQDYDSFNLVCHVQQNHRPQIGADLSRLRSRKPERQRRQSLRIPLHTLMC